MRKKHSKIFNLKIMTQQYNIYSFEWLKEANLFLCKDPIPGVHPIGREQFYIVNSDTGGFRRFRYTQTRITHSELPPYIGSDVYNQFESEDGIQCFIKIKNEIVG